MFSHPGNGATHGVRSAYEVWSGRVVYPNRLTKYDKGFIIMPMGFLGLLLSARLSSFDFIRSRCWGGLTGMP